MNKNIVAALVNFNKSVDKEVTTFLDNDFETPLELTLKVNDKEIKLDMHSELYMELDAFLNKAILDEASQSVDYEALQMLADFQEAYINKHKKVPNHFISFEAFGKTIMNPFHMVDKMVPVDPVDHYSKLFLHSDWLTKGPAWVELLRETAIKVCEHNDSDGEYRGSDFKTAVWHFMYTVCHDIVEYKEFFDDLSACIDYLHNVGYTSTTLELLDQLSRTTDFEQAMADIYEYGIKGFEAGTYTIALPKPNKKMIVGHVGSGKSVMEHIKRLMEDEANGQKDMG